MKLDFTGQVALVTGGTRGIGKQIAEDYRACGARVIVTGTHPHDARTGAEQDYLQVDYLDPRSVADFVEKVRQIERIDVCVNNAGINRINDVEATKADDWDALIAVNLTGAFRTLQAVVPAMKRRRYGRIVNIGSVFGEVSRAKRIAYTTTKYGIRGITTTAAIELARDNILVNTVSPGFVDTELTRRILKPAEIEALAAQVPIQRLASPAEISPVVLFLSSSLITYLTGQNVVVDGGFVHV